MHASDAIPVTPQHPDNAFGTSRVETRTDANILRSLVVTAGICWSIVFVVIGLRYQLQTYGDGAMFSYSVGVQDAWAFHWHNISGRAAVFLLTLLPAEIVVGLTGDPSDGVIVYGFLFFVAPLLGLIATFAADRSKGRIIFAYACFSAACLCPLVFGFPTELWLAQALFWPALAVTHFARRTIGGTVLTFVLLLALIFTHEGALVLAAAIVATHLPRGMRDTLFLRAAVALFVAVSIWAAVKLAFPPGDYFADVYVRAALGFFDLNVFTGDLLRLLIGTIFMYAFAFLVLVRLSPAKAHVYAASIVAVALVTYWAMLDHGLHAADRYYLRCALVGALPILGGIAALHACWADGRLTQTRLIERLTRPVTVRAIAGAFTLLMLVHAVETAKFVAEWTKYKAVVLALAIGTSSDPALGDPRFVSSDRIDAGLRRLSWFSTTPYLSIVVANFAPTRLVIDPRANNYFWLSCKTATANFKAERAVPAAARDLVRVNACLHR